VNTYTIHEPIWDGRCVGICDQRFADGDLLVKISYRVADGSKLYPHTYIVHPEQVKGYPTKMIKSHRIIIIPIEDLEIYKKGRIKKVKEAVVKPVGKAVQGNLFEEGK
jgi:hypothetical protein